MSHKQVKGVADNKSYKDTYHFDDHFMNGDIRKELPSLNVDPAINTSIKKNPYRSNVEIEKDEVILKPDLSALFKARGKSHKQGGIDVMLEPESFVFSDDKTLSFGEKDHELFEFKKGSNFKKEKNTPADVLKRNIDVKHYNTLVSNITDIKKDDLAKKSSTMMLEKYISTLGNIAYLQEAKKDFPTGLPAFSVGTAPVYREEVKDDVMEQKQYAKYGGSINPYMQGGGTTYKASEYYGQGNKQGAIVQFGDKKYIFDHGTWKLASDNNTKTSYPGFTGKNINAADYHGQGNKEGVTQKFGDKTYKFTNGHWKEMIAPDVVAEDNGNADNVNSGVPFIDDPKLPPIGRYMPPAPIHSSQLRKPDIKIPGAPNLPFINVPQIKGPADTGKDIDWNFTPWQRVSQGYNAMKYATARRYMPMRSQFNPAYTEASYVNPEQAIGDMQGIANQSIASLNTLNPILRNAQAAATTGDIMNRIPGVRSQYDNQNVGIRNQNAAMNTQITNNARGVNMQNDQNYYQQSVVGQQNFDNLRSYLGDQYMNNVIGDVQDNQTLAYNLATLDNPAYGYNFKTGNFYRNPKDIRGVKGSQQGDLIGGLLQELIPKFNTLDPRVQSALLKTASLKNLPLPSGYKKGGKVRNPYK